MATCAFTSGDLASAERFLLNAQRANADDAQTLMNLALLYSKQGKKAEAVKLYTRIVSSPDTPEDWKAEASARLKELQ